MTYFLWGVAALLIALTAMKWFTHANPAALAANAKLAAGVAAMAAALLFLLRGGVGPALLLAMLGASLLGWWGGLGGLGAGQSGGPSRQTSRLTTDMLDVELDHDTGAVTGRVLKGLFEGRALESLKPVEVALLWRDCQFIDPQSVQVLEAYLDRLHPTWREDMARGEQAMHAAPDGRMTQAEAYEILGLGPGVSEEEIRRAHRELMLKLHPDRGGSTYLASKINEAKDVLLGG